MGSLERKLRRKDDKEKAKYISDVKSEAKNIAEKVVDKAILRAYDEAVEVATAKVMAVTAEIIWNHWSELARKDTRLQTFVKLMEEKLQKVENPTEEQIEVEKLLAERCGIKFGRKENG